MIQNQHALYRSEFPLSNSYDPEWVMDNQMGPNALWLMEWLCQDLDLKAEMRVLDLGCGTAMTSIFLARELGVSFAFPTQTIHVAKPEDMLHPDPPRTDVEGTRRGRAKGAASHL